MPPNGSISNIAGSYFVYPGSGEFPRLFFISKIMKITKISSKFRGRVILRNSPYSVPILLLEFIVHTLSLFFCLSLFFLSNVGAQSTLSNWMVTVAAECEMQNDMGRNNKACRSPDICRASKEETRKQQDLNEILCQQRGQHD